MDAIYSVLDTFGLEAHVALATRPEKSVGGDEIWENAETQLRSVLESQNIDYDLEPGDGAFYGPKIDFAFEDALGRQWDGPTVQLDFNSVSASRTVRGHLDEKSVQHKRNGYPT